MSARTISLLMMEFFSSATLFHSTYMHLHTHTQHFIRLTCTCTCTHNLSFDLHAPAPAHPTFHYTSMHPHAQFHSTCTHRARTQIAHSRMTLKPKHVCIRRAHIRDICKHPHAQGINTRTCTAHTRAHMNGLTSILLRVEIHVDTHRYTWPRQRAHLSVIRIQGESLGISL